MKKVFIPTTLALFLATGLVATESHQADTAATTAAATATDKMAAEKDANHAPATTVSTADHMADAHPAAKVVVVKNKKSGGHHHSKVNVKEADDLTAKLNAMTCPSSAAPAA